MRQTQVRDNWHTFFRSLIRSRVLLFYIATYLLFAASGLRMIMAFYDTPYRRYILGLLAAYFILLSTERLISRWWSSYQPAYYAMQILIVLAFTLARPIFDYYAILFTGLCIQAIWFSSSRMAGIVGAVVMVSIVISEMALFGLLGGISYSLIYIGAAFFITIFSVATVRAEKARAESQALLVELQVANRKLQDYAERVEELATAQERNRLARELHDSVTQTIFSMTLTAQSALILIDRDPQRVKEQLNHLQTLAKSALSEMRALIQQLRPRTLAEEGLVAALQRHAAERGEKDGLSVDLKVLANQDPPPRLPADAEEAVFRVIQESLNNVVKHARTDRAAVRLDFRSNPASITIEDQGVGFDPNKPGGAPGHLGLTSMEERVRAIGGRLTVDSKPGAGTCIRIDNLRIEEREDA